MEPEIILEEVLDLDEELSELYLFGKILSQKILNRQGVTNIINLAWKTKESFTISPWRDNIYLFCFKSISDKIDVVQKSPWSVMNNLMVLEEVQKGVTVEEMDFSLCPFWIQVHGLPISCMTKANASKIGKQFVELIEVERIDEKGGLLLSRSSLRIKVMVDTSKPLLRGFFHKRAYTEVGRLGENLWINFKYERLSDFYFLCDRVGHEKNSCKFPLASMAGGHSYDHELKTASLRDLKMPDHLS